MQQGYNQHDFYGILSVQPEAGEPEIIKAHEALAASLDPDNKPAEEKKDAALNLLSADAARDVLLDSQKREEYDAKLIDVQKAQSEKEKIEAKRAGKLQEQQSIEEDEKLKQASLHLEAAQEILADFYYDHLFASARKRTFNSVPLEKVLEWLSSDRVELLRKAEQKGRRISFRIDWHGFGNIQEMRKQRGEQIGHIVGRLVDKLEKGR